MKKGILQELETTPFLPLLTTACCCLSADIPDIPHWDFPKDKLLHWCLYAADILFSGRVFFSVSLYNVYRAIVMARLLRQFTWFIWLARLTLSPGKRREWTKSCAYLDEFGLQVMMYNSDNPVLSCLVWCAVIWATHQLSDNKLGDTSRSTGRQCLILLFCLVSVNSRFTVNIKSK